MEWLCMKTVFKMFVFNSIFWNSLGIPNAWEWLLKLQAGQEGACLDASFPEAPALNQPHP